MSANEKVLDYLKRAETIGLIRGIKEDSLVVEIAKMIQIEELAELDEVTSIEYKRLSLEDITKILDELNDDEEDL